MVQVTVTILFYFDEICKIKEGEPKKRAFFYIIWKFRQNLSFWAKTASIFIFINVKQMVH